jgi:phosphatidylglycerophosphate synthase
MAVSEPRRAGRELLLEGVFRPVARVLLPLFLRARIPPPVVVLANAAVGLVAAFELARGQLVTAALLLQLKTLLDNLDGELARASEQVTLTGRYLDTLADLFVNATLFVVLGYVTGEAVLAAVAFVALSVVLAVDFNVTELAREALSTPTPRPARTGRPVERALAGAYDTLLGPLDRGVRALAARRFGGRVVYDPGTLTVLANLGLTTQLVVLGVCVLVGVPEAYLWFTIACLLALVPLQLRAERRARAAIAS